nr:hypothetical protein Iba_chr12cCG12460 [Ipomoea batatas]
MPPTPVPTTIVALARQSETLLEVGVRKSLTSSEMLLSYSSYASRGKRPAASSQLPTSAATAPLGSEVERGREEPGIRPSARVELHCHSPALSEEQRKYAIAAPSTSVVLTAWRKRTQVSLCRCHARQSPPLSPRLAAATVASRKCAAMSPVPLHRRRRRVTLETTIAADSELTKRRPSRCRSIEEKKQGVDRGASSSYATAQHRRCMEDVCCSPDCHPSSSSSPTSIGIALLVAAIASRSLPEEKARSFAAERERRTGRKKEVRLHAMPPSLVFNMDAATLSYCLS